MDYSVMSDARVKGIAFLTALLAGLGMSHVAYSMGRFQAADRPAGEDAAGFGAASLPVGAELRRDPVNRTVTFLRATPLSAGLDRDAVFARMRAENRFAEIAMAFVDAHHELFRLRNPQRELVAASVVSEPTGFKHIRFSQVFDGVEVWAAELNIHLDKDNHVYLVQGHYQPTPSGLDMRPVLEAAGAARAAAAAVEGAEPDCTGCRTRLVIFAAADALPRLSYQVDVTVSLREAWRVLVDAHSGTILDKIATVYSGGTRLRPGL